MTDLASAAHELAEGALLEVSANETNTTSVEVGLALDPSFFSRVLGHLEQFDYYHYQDSLIRWLSAPVNYVLFEVPFTTKLLIVAITFLIIGVIIPLGIFIYKYIKALCHPITFSYKHVLITGCTGGLGKALVQEIFMKGAYITMVGRDREVL